MSKQDTLPPIGLRGVDHTARPTWKLRETVEFYRDKMGLPLVHAITARGWGRSKEKHPDFIHFFFDAGNNSTIAFFYYIRTEQPASCSVPRGYMGMAAHTAWRVNTEADLMEWRERLLDAGVEVSAPIQHEVLESIYFRDPNFYPLEITRPLRNFQRTDALDAQLTIESALELVDSQRWDDIEQLWQVKARRVAAYQNSGGSKSSQA